MGSIIWREHKRHTAIFNKMEPKVSIDNVGHGKQPNELIIKIRLEEVFTGDACHPEHDPGVVIHYIINLDGKDYEVSKPTMTGSEILALAGYSTNTRRLFEIGEGQRPIEPEEVVDFKRKGIERFRSLPKTVREGKGSATGALPISLLINKAFELLPNDNDYLERLRLPWETKTDGGARWILIYDFPVPLGYNVSKTTLAFMLPPSFPTTEIDMMYFHPALSRTDGKGINALSGHQLGGVPFQRWSRHRNQGEWRPDIDNVETHVLSVHAWLYDELKK
jgi:hypothetical protein